MCYYYDIFAVALHSFSLSLSTFSFETYKRPLARPTPSPTLVPLSFTHKKPPPLGRLGSRKAPYYYGD